ncbi:YqcI/YcgG family protein [Streptomyces sp900105755]|uniref:YqcI/YcgG family protein n=1 Tax=Streptomyces sp. 900105755 TaxID=3154389 RepID=A0ABV1TYA4_9ACTN
MNRDNGRRMAANPIVVAGSQTGSRPSPKLHVGQIQAAVERVSLREGSGAGPLSAAFHLLDTCSNLETAIGRGDLSDLGVSVASLYVTSSWIADVYGVTLKKSYQDLGHNAAISKLIEDRRPAGRNREAADTLAAARASLTDIMRNIALYGHGYGSAGQDTLRPLSEVIAEFQISLLDISVSLGLDVTKVLESGFHEEALDAFSGGDHNPRHAAAVKQFTPISNRTYCPFAVTANLWGAPDYDRTLSVAEHVRASVGLLRHFTRAALRENLDGFIYAFPADLFGRDMGQLGDLLRTLVEALMQCDQVNSRPLQDEDFLKEKWRFSFDGEDYFVPVFAPLYGPGHNRFTYEVRDQVFVVLQPDSSFHRRMGGKGGEIRTQIRQRFRDGFQPYDNSNETEPGRFLQSPNSHSKSPKWYQADEA